MLKPRWRNWYLAEFYYMTVVEWVLLMITFMAWYVNAPTFKLKCMCFSHILFCLALYVLTELFEFVWKRICK